MLMFSPEVLLPGIPVAWVLFSLIALLILKKNKKTEKVGNVDYIFAVFIGFTTGIMWPITVCALVLYGVLKLFGKKVGL